MKKQIAVCCALLIFLAFCPVKFAQQTAQAQDTQQTPPSVTDTQQRKYPGIRYSAEQQGELT